MHYLVQENLFSERHYYDVLKAIERMGYTYDIVTVLPFTEEVRIRKDDDKFEELVIENKNVFCFGSVKFAHISAKKGWYPGSLFNENHDWNVYSKQYGDLMLNHDAIVQKLSDSLPENLPTLFFARPCKDTKLFNGGVFMKDSWNDMVDALIVNHTHRDIKDDTVMFSSLKEIAWETRCWIVDGKVVTMSEYKRGRFVRYQNLDGEDWLKEIVQKYVDIYQPAKAFVMDVCKLVDSDEIKIVEINCINCAGFYDSNIQKMLNALEETFSVDDNLVQILQEFEALKGQFVITESHKIERLVAIGDDTTDYYYVTYDGKKLTWNTCVGKIIPLKGYLKDSDYNEFIRLAKLNHLDQATYWKNTNRDIVEEWLTLSENDKFLTPVCLDLN